MRFSILMLSSVVSEASPGSSFLTSWVLLDGEVPLCGVAGAVLPVAVERVRGRLDGGLAEASMEGADFLCLEDIEGLAAGVGSSASSPEASREEGWRRSVVEDLGMEEAAR